MEKLGNDASNLEGLAGKSAGKILRSGARRSDASTFDVIGKVVCEASK